MLDQLKKLVKEYAKETIGNNPAVPEHHKTAVEKDVAEKIYEGLKDEVKVGNIAGLTALLQGATNLSLNSDPIIKKLTGSVATSLALKFGLTSFASHQIATRLVPNVLNDFPTLQDFNLEDTLNNLGAEVKEREATEDFNYRKFKR